MEDKFEEILKQYPFQVRSRKRTRGGFLLETEQGLCLLTEYSSSLPRLEFEERIKEKLSQQGYQQLDIAYKNSKGEYFTKDAYRNNWIVRKWQSGTECDIRREEDVLHCAAHLGKLHKLMQLGERQESDYCQKESIQGEMERHNKELKRVRSYIRNKKQKNEMEICLLNSFDLFYEQGYLAQSLLQESRYDELWNQTLEQGRICHGNYTYHNVLLSPKGIATTHFEKAEIGIQIRDLYQFMRKVMEKNGWESSLGISVIKEYQKERSFEPGEGELLYTLLLYPEKYWKLVNFYYNNRKSWSPAKNLEKLKKICHQQEQRMACLEKIKGLLFSESL